jgi:Protein of unknown function (DUF2868)
VRDRASWNIPSVIDFEFLLAADARGDEERLRERDREIFHRAIQPSLTPGSEAKRSGIFRAWLKARRSESDAPSPGEQIAAGWQTVAMLAVFIGLGMGFSVTAAFLHYKGTEPVNVFWFLICTVGVQMVIFIVAGFLWLLRKTTNLLDDFHPLRWLLLALVWSFSAGLRRLPGEQRERLRGALAALSRKREIYGSLAVWPFLIVTQVFAVGFNVGILAVLLAHVAFTDLDFGWQSTFISSSDAVYRATWLISLPWHWAPFAHPMPADIMGSHFQYKPGLAGLSPVALKSWWPFLAYTVAFYGLALRSALLIFAAVKLQRALDGLQFDHEGCNALFRRLTGPLVAPQLGTAVLEIPDKAPLPAPHITRVGDCIALVATDADLDEKELAQYAQAKFGWRLKQTLPASIDHPSGNPDIMDALGRSGSDLAGVLVIARSKRSPIKAIALFLQKVTAAAGSKPETILLLIGRKEGELRDRVPDDEFGYWRNFHAINGLRLGLERWTPS